MILLESAEIIGGANKVALMTARALADDGVQVGVFAGSATADAMVRDHPNIKLCLIDEVNFWASKGFGNKLSRVTTNPVATRALAEFLSQFPVADTIVHGHTFNSVLTASCLGVAIDLGFRTIVTCHDYGLACPNALFYDHRRVEICPKRALSLGCIGRACTPDAYPHKLVRVARTAANWYRYRVPQRLSAAIVVSELSLQALRPYFGDQVAFHMLPYPQDLREHAPVEVAKNSTFLYSGRLTPEKNPTILAKVARKLGIPVRFLGSGPEEAEIRRLNPDAEITGWMPPDQVHETLRSSRALAMTSIWYECQPLVTIEAQSHGLPIICSDSCASREEVNDGIDGFLFRSKDETSLEQALTRLLDDDTATRLGQNSYQKVWSNPPSATRHLRDLYKIYDQILEK